MEKTFAVSKYLSAVKKLITSQIPPIWVNGVITQITERGRMVYLSIAEFPENDVKPVAKLDLYMFAGEYAQMLSLLRELPTPFVLKEQLKVNLFVEADFYIGSFQENYKQYYHSSATSKISIRTSRSGNSPKQSRLFSNGWKRKACSTATRRFLLPNCRSKSG